MRWLKIGYVNGWTMLKRIDVSYALCARARFRSQNAKTCKTQKESDKYRELELKRKEDKEKKKSETK